MKATLSDLDSAILPALGHLRVGSAVPTGIARFFHEYGRRKPARRRETQSRHPAHHVRLRHRLGSSLRSRREPVRRNRPLLPSTTRAAAWRGPAQAGSERPGMRRSGASHPADGMQAGRDTLPALARGQARSVDTERLKNRTETPSARRGGAGVAELPRWNGVRGVSVSWRQGNWASEYERPVDILDQGARRGRDCAGCAASRPAPCARLARRHERRKPACCRTPSLSSAGVHDLSIRPSRRRDAGQAAERLAAAIQRRFFAAGSERCAKRLQAPVNPDPRPGVRGHAGNGSDAPRAAGRHSLSL